MEDLKGHLDRVDTAPKHELSGRHFHIVVFDELELCKYSAQEAITHGVTRINSVFTAKVLYEVIFPQHLRGETRYLKGPRFMDRNSRSFPDFLMENDWHYKPGKLNGRPNVLFAGRVGRVENKPYIYPECEKYRWFLDDPIRAHMPASLGFNEREPDRHGCEVFSLRPDYDTLRSRGLNCARSRTQSILGGEMDVFEFVFQYYGEHVAMRYENQPWRWMYLSQSEVVEPDFAKAIFGAAQAVLDQRSTYQCRKMLHNLLNACGAPQQILESKRSIAGWKIIEDKWRSDSSGLQLRPDEHRLNDNIRFEVGKRIPPGGSDKKDSTAVVKRDKKVMSRSETLTNISDRLHAIQTDIVKWKTSGEHQP
ncbi:hypothetical protein D6C77_08201 [Aureobasidium pullulans]|nr:hypothetical protein D6C77_08201 [Aureobasidium pullulans]